MIALLAVKFNHNTNSARDDALSIRKNAASPIPVPEWERGMTKASQSTAAYALRSTAGNTVTIQAKFARVNPGIASAYVRAVQPPPKPPPPGWKNWLTQMLEKFPILWYLIAFMFVTGHGKNLLGEVKERVVNFGADGESQFESFELANHWMQKRGVGIHTVHWRWQYRVTSSGPWVDFDDSKHQIYTVLEVPTAPWQQDYQVGKNIQLPWTDVLDYACEWAAWTSAVDDAAGQVTRTFNKLGGSKVVYSGASHWFTSSKDFDCTSFLAVLGAPPGTAAQRVDCTDSATVLSTFANILGCDLSQSQMCDPTDPFVVFDTNPIQPVGSSGFSTTSWNYHEVAWTGACGQKDRVFDGSLSLNGNSNPTTPPYSELEPINMEFGAAGAGKYRDKLAAPPAANRDNCYPRQKPRRRSVK